MKLVDLSIRRPIGVLMIVIAILLMGTISLKNLAIDLYPKLNLPIAIVVTDYKGAAPQEVEKLVTKPLEGTLGTIEGIKRLQSTSSPGQSLIILQFDWGANMDEKVNSMRDKLDLVTSFLPEEAGKPLVLKLDPTAIPIVRLSVSGDMDGNRLTQIAEDIIKPRLERTPGVANVSLLGAKEKEVKVEVSPVYLSGYGLSINQIIQILSSENLAATAGNVNKGDQELLLRINGEFANVDQIKNVLIPLPKGGTVKLKDIAKVTEVNKEVTEITRVLGKPSLSFDISKKSDGNTIQVTNELYKSLNEIKKVLPEGVHIDTVYDLSIFIRQSIDNVIQNLIVGGTLAIAILYLFLRNLRTTLIISLTMPIAVISTFNLIYFTGESLNLLTLGGLALGIGMMVDSAIVILENIFRYREQGYNLLEAASVGTKEVGPAVIASALTTVAVFLPIVFVKGLAAELFRPLALTVSFSLLASLVASLTLVPMLAARMLKHEDPDQKALKGLKKWTYKVLFAFHDFMEKVYRKYRSLLSFALTHRKTVVFGTLALVIAAFALIPFVGTEFIPAMDQGEINIDVKLPEGTLLEETDKTIGIIEEKLTQIPEVKTVFTTAGGAGAFQMDLANSSKGNLYVRLVPLDQRERSTDEVMEEIRNKTKDIPNVEIKVSQIQSGGFGSQAPITIMISGDDLNALADIAEQVKSIVQSVEGTRNVESSIDKGRPEMQIIVNREKASRYGLTFAQIMNTVRTGFNGQVATRFRMDGQEIDVRVTLPDEYKQDMKQVGDILLQSPLGIQVPLKEVATLIQENGPAKIQHEDQRRQVQVTSDIVNRDLGSITKDIQGKLDQLQLPDGYMIEIGGQVKDMMEAFGDLQYALILAIFLVYMVMAVQFEAITYPFIIMFSMPATFVGIVVGLVVTGWPLSIPAFIGIIMLAGIVVNNAIVLVDYVNILRRRGMERTEAILTAGPNRLRPILMTTLTTILGLIPLMLGIGEGAETQAPLATVLVFGLSFSTLVTLVLVPVVYLYIDDLENWLKRKWTKNMDSMIQ
ncbi:efflux RND transporter permease subunit [Tepidibacillus sp. LV47]|uniref:efflux RND transporter permease subunit n=1 Tax=Tepidibacillus sp. LV47 TaxID=3398228 RepID=UPI003AAE24BB